MVRLVHRAGGYGIGPVLSPLGILRGPYKAREPRHRGRARGGRHLVVYRPPPDEPVERTRHTSSCTSALLALLKEVGQPLSVCQAVTALSARGFGWTANSVNPSFRRLTKRGLVRCFGSRPLLYELPPSAA